jgi:hypothetical protein
MLNSGSGEFHKSKGNEYFKQGNFAEAIKHYTSAIDQNEDSHIIRSNRSACFHQTGRYQEALHDARIAILKAPGWYKGHCRKAASHVALGEYEEARRDYATARELEPNDPLVLQALAEVDAQLTRDQAQSRTRSLSILLQSHGAGPDLDLRGQALGDEGVRRLSESLATNLSVRRLWLDSNGVADAGATALATALRRNRNLTLLGLNGNDIGDAGATAIAAALPANQGLQEVLLEGNRVGLAGGEALARALEANPRVRRLALGQNRILAAESAGADAGPRVSLRECANLPAPWLRTCAPGGGGGGGGGGGDVDSGGGCGTRLLACAAAGGSCDPLWRPRRGCNG